MNLQLNYFNLSFEVSNSGHSGVTSDQETREGKVTNKDWYVGSIMEAPDFCGFPSSVRRVTPAACYLIATWQ